MLILAQAKKLGESGDYGIRQWNVTRLKVSSELYILKEKVLTELWKSASARTWNEKYSPVGVVTMHSV